MALYPDLQSMQEARDLAEAAYKAQLVWGRASQEEVDRVCAAMAEAAFAAAARLGQMAHDETGYGIPAHKKLKNELASMGVWNSIKDVKTVGVIRRDEQRRIYEIAWPMGVVAALTPSTNPTSTAIFKSISAVKARDAIIIAPHPSAAKCTSEACRIMQEAAQRAGAPANLVNCMQNISLQGTNGAAQAQICAPDPGHRRDAHGESRPFGRQTRLRRGPGQRAGIRGPQR